jgi:hypothetical protein
MIRTGPRNTRAHGSSLYGASGVAPGRPNGGAGGGPQGRTWPNPTPTRSNPPPKELDAGTGSALGAALALSDERSSLVVLQGDDCKPATAWLAYLPACFVDQFLIGHQSICILLQQQDESVSQLQQRVRERLQSLETPPQRLLWITPDDAQGERVSQLQSTLTRHCGAQVEVLLVTGDSLTRVVPLVVAESATPDPGAQDPGVQDPGVQDATEQGPAVLGPTSGRPPSAPPRSEVRWSRPVQEGAQSPCAELASGCDSSR